MANSTGSNKNCNILSARLCVSADTLSFGNYNPSQGDSLSSGTIRTEIYKATPYGIGLIYSNYGINNTIKYGFIASDGNKWINYKASQTSGDRLGYNIYQDGGLTKIFGIMLIHQVQVVKANGSSVSIYKTGTGEEQITTMYGAMSGGQYVTQKIIQLMLEWVYILNIRNVK